MSAMATTDYCFVFSSCSAATQRSHHLFTNTHQQPLRKCILNSVEVQSQDIQCSLYINLHNQYTYIIYPHGMNRIFEHHFGICWPSLANPVEPPFGSLSQRSGQKVNYFTSARHRIWVDHWSEFVCRNNFDEKDNFGFNGSKIWMIQRTWL